MLNGIIWWQLVIAAILAVIPVIIWIKIMLKKDFEGSKGKLVLIFLLGTLTVLPLIGIQYLWYLNPEWDVYLWIEENIATTNIAAGFLATFIVVGIMEEIVKGSVVRIADTGKSSVKTINDAVKFSILAALGFAFSENIHYFYSVLKQGDFGATYSTVVFRSSFTVCAHMVFSAIFGYYYGMGKFSKHLIEQEEWTGEKYSLANLLNKVKIPKHFIVKHQKIFMGLLIAMVMHAAFNFFLSQNMMIEAMSIILIGFIFVQFLMHRKAGKLVLTGAEGQSSMAEMDEDVVLELIGMWFNAGKYEDVIEICDRLLLKDPDNKVIKLFKAKAVDKAKVGKAVNSIKSLFAEKDTGEDMHILETLRKNKEEKERIATIKDNAVRLLDEKDEK